MLLHLGSFITFRSSTGGEERGQTTAGNFNFWLFGDRNVQGDEWVIQTRYLRYIQAFWGWIGGNIFSWQLCCIFCILTQTKSRVGDGSKGHGPADSLS